MRRRMLAMLAALALMLVAAAAMAVVVCVVGRVLSGLLGFCLFVWAVIA